MLVNTLTTAETILVALERIYSYQFKSNNLKNNRVFAAFSLDFWYLHEIVNLLKKQMSLIGQVFLEFLSPKDVLI